MTKRELIEALASYPDHWPVVVETPTWDGTHWFDVVESTRENLPTSGNVVCLLTDQ